MAEPDDQDFSLDVTVRLYGGGTAEEAAQALRDHPETFDLPNDREVEIIDAQPATHGVPRA
jgi:hypothetical protein